MEIPDPLKLIAALQMTLERQEGELLATQLAVRAMLLSHPEPDAAEQALTRKLEEFAATILASDSSDAFLHGFEVARRRVFPSAMDRQQSPPGSPRG